MVATKNSVRTDPIFLLLCVGGLVLTGSLFLTWLTYIHVACYNVCAPDQVQSLNLFQVLSPNFHDQLSPAVTNLMNSAYFPTLDLLFFSGFLGIVMLILRVKKYKQNSPLTAAQRKREGLALWERKGLIPEITLLSCITTFAAFMNIQTHTSFVDTSYNSSQILQPAVVVSGVTMFLLGSVMLSFAGILASYGEWRPRQKGSTVQA